MHLKVRVVFCVGFLLLTLGNGMGAERPGEISMRQALVLKSVSRAGRSVVHTDPVEALIVSGQWHAPVSGEKVSAAGGEREWEVAATKDDGWLQPSGMRGGYVYWAVESPRDQVMILEAAGHNLAYVNGEVRGGDPYAYGYDRLPVQLHAGTNDLLFQCSRGRMRAMLSPPDSPLLFNDADTTLPDVREGDKGPLKGAIIIINASTHDVQAVVRSKGSKTAESQINVPALGMRKAGFTFYPPRKPQGDSFQLPLELRDHAHKNAVLARAELKIRVRHPDQTYKRTFVSPMDDSVQYYAVNPAPSSVVNAPALFLSLHGASVEAIGQADAYSSKRWGNIVCPTNRRPYGFDWEEWGRQDAMEVLAQAVAHFQPDPSRIYLTGHSMGGHGTWQLGAIYPDRFAAIGASAGWISFTSYVERNQSEGTNGVDQILARANGPSDTLLMATNYLQEGVYILHGDADDNVPVREARKMRQVLGEFHRDFDFHEQPGAGHWWDASDEPGADCVDWAPMFDFFAHHVIPSDASLRRVRFVTLNPAVCARSHWVTVLAQEHALEPSSVDIQCDPLKRRLVGVTTNIAAIGLELPLMQPGSPLMVELDGQKLENIPWPAVADCSAICGIAGLNQRPMVCLTREEGRWQVGHPPSVGRKNPRRSGPFRMAFQNHMVFVYGTHGSAEETRLLYGKARYDAETFWYRGNGSVELMSDEAFLRPAKSHGRNVIVYGNADNNSAWPTLLGSSPVQVKRGSVRVGGREITGDNLACLFLQPHPGDDHALVGVVAGSGLPGLRLTERLPYFLSGAAFPDCLVVGTEMLANGSSGIRAAGFFGNDWSVEHGEFSWN